MCALPQHRDLTHLGRDIDLHGRVAARINDLRPNDAPIRTWRTRSGAA